MPLEHTYKVLASDLVSKKYSQYILDFKDLLL